MAQNIRYNIQMLEGMFKNRRLHGELQIDWTNV